MKEQGGIHGIFDVIAACKSSLSLAFIGAIMPHFAYFIFENSQIGSFNKDMSADNK